MLITSNQTWLDITIKQTGELKQLFAVAAANEVSITDIPEAGTEGVEPNVSVNVAMKDYMARNNVNPGTRGDSGMIGIGYYTIGVNFTII